MTTPKATCAGIALIAALYTGVILGLTACTDEADFNAGVAAYNRGDYATALREWRPLAKQGHAKAQYNLGFMYALGRDVPQDYAEAVGWYRKAAAQGYAEAQNVLGFMYGEGQGVPQDYVQAHMWLNIAAPRFPPGEHRDNAVNNRDIVAKRMTPAQKSEAEQLGKEWLVEHPEVR